jgi:iron complex outermembrane recepter protein
LRATANYGADSIVGGNVDLGGRFGADQEFGLRVNGVYRSGQTAVDHEHRDVGVAGASFDFRKGPGRFFLDFGYEDQRANWSRPTVRLATGIAVPRVPAADDNYGQPWTYTKLRDIYGIARTELDLTRNVMGYLAFGFRDGSEKGEYSTLTITNAATGAGTASRLFVPREDNNYSGQVGIRGKLTVGGVSNEFNVGGSLNYSENRNSFSFGAFPASVRTACGAAATSFCTNLYAAPQVALPANSTLPASGGSLTVLPRVATSQLGSVFASDTLGVLNDRILVTVGVRQQQIAVQSYNRGTLQRTTTYDESATTPVVGVIVKPSDHFSLYANRIEGLAQGPTAPLTNVTNPGEVFAPFKSTQYEVGGKLAVRGLTGTLAFYQTRQPSTYLQPVAGSTLSTFVVDGEQTNRGIELTFNGEPSRFIRLIGGLTINDAKITRSLNGTNNGKVAVGVPGYQANLGTEIVLPFVKGLTLTGRVVVTGHQYLDIINLQRVDDWTRFDLGARYVAVVDNHPVTLRVSAENIDNRRYWYSAFGGYLLQGTPRTVKASLTFEY